MKTFVMTLTYSRIFSGPIIFILVVFFDQFFLSLALFSLTSITDFFDGYLARKFSVESKLGKLLDPIADKILLCSSLISIFLVTNDSFIGLMGMLILLREFWIAGLREFSAKNNLTNFLDVSLTAKFKTATQFTSIACFYFSFSANSSLGLFLSSFILFISLLLSIKSGINYSVNIFSKLK